jgi:hypothetical protein
MGTTDARIVGHDAHFFAHLAASLYYPGDETWEALCGVEFEPSPASRKQAEGKPVCGACQDLAKGQ